MSEEPCILWQMREAVGCCSPRPCEGRTPHLPGAQALEEEEESEAPHDRGADDAEQGDQQQALTTPELQGGEGSGGQFGDPVRDTQGLGLRNCPAL